jgi:succinate dehydrogenase / fumarate reductase cytochrome b subunit
VAQDNKAVRERPLSPHLQVWRWHITMLSSILHRATGVALYGTILIAAGWAVALASGPFAYAAYLGYVGSPLGKLVLFGATVSIFFHLANGVRHLTWDTGEGLKPKTADMTAAAAMAFAIAASLAVWVIAILTGKF